MENFHSNREYFENLAQECAMFSEQKDEDKRVRGELTYAQEVLVEEGD